MRSEEMHTAERGGRRRLALLLAAAAVVAGAAPNAPAPQRFDTVVLDAGHGGDDGGARGEAGLREKDLVLDIAKRLGRELEERGLRVVLTREKDVFVPLEERTWIANDARGDLFLSIHANAAEDREARGTETYFMSLRASDAAAQRVAERENAAFGAAGRVAASGDDSFLALMGDLITGDYARDSNEFALLAQTELAARDSRSRGVKQAPFVVLANVQMPSVLVEIGFLTNADEERRLAAGSARDEIVRALSRAVGEFGRRYDARRGNGAGPSTGTAE
jgi:N-acetylmuramoyl-L-alanine amidase